MSGGGIRVSGFASVGCCFFIAVLFMYGVLCYCRCGLCCNNLEQCKNDMCCSCVRHYGVS